MHRVTEFWMYRLFQTVNCQTGSGMTMPILRRDSTFYVIKYVN